jgi:hypothetical protein
MAEGQNSLAGEFAGGLPASAVAAEDRGYGDANTHAQLVPTVHGRAPCRA